MTSQAAQLAGVNATTTVNGYIGCWSAGASAGFRLRRVKLGVIAGAGVPTSQQISVAIYRQTVLPAGTGLTNIAGQAFETWTPTDPTGGLTVTTATTIGTTGPTLSAQPLDIITFNTQSNTDTPWEFMEEIIVGSGTANGVAFVNIGNTLPASHSINVSVEVEV
jgi:hypothetical protein